MKHRDDGWRQGGFGLYVHWPFCEAKCPYCDFNSHVDAAVDQARWRAALVQEIDRVGEMTPGRVLDSVFFGGGTPSLMPPETIAAIFERVRATWQMSHRLEATLEANPRSVEAGRFAGYRDAGVNRLSLGVQSLRDADLQRLGRLHSAAEARTALETARRIFPRVSFDLIYARQDQSLADWQGELAEALALEPDHLSLYQLTVEPGTAFGNRLQAGRLPGLPDEDLAADMYEATQDLCDAAGLPAYEVSNHARDGAAGRHNRIYWSAGDYAGIGPGAHGRLTIAGGRHAIEAIRQPAAWLRAVEAGRGVESVTPLSRDDEALEYLLMGLRLTDGISLTRLAAMAGRSLSADAARDLIASGHVETDDEWLRATRAGRIVLNGIIRRLAEAWQLGATAG